MKTAKKMVVHYTLKYVGSLPYNSPMGSLAAVLTESGEGTAKPRNELSGVWAIANTNFNES